MIIVFRKPPKRLPYAPSMSLLEGFKFSVLRACGGPALCGLAQKEGSEMPQGRALAWTSLCGSVLEKRLCNVSVVEGKDAGQNTKLLMHFLTCAEQPCGKIDSGEENPLHLPVGTGCVVDRNLAQQGWSDLIKATAISVPLPSQCPLLLR